MHAGRIERRPRGRAVAAQLVRPGGVQVTRPEIVLAPEEVRARHLRHLEQAVGVSLVEQELGTVSGYTPMHSDIRVAWEAAQCRSQRVELPPAI
jgi:hypothetical protein